MKEPIGQLQRVADLKRVRMWVEECGAPVFPTWNSFEWFLRRHPELRNSPGWHDLPNGSYVNPPLFEPDVLRALGVAQAA